MTDPAGGKQKGECVWGRGEVQRPSILWRRFPNQVASSSKCRGLRVYRPEYRRQSFQRGLFQSMKNSGSTEKSRSSGYLEATFRKNKILWSIDFPKSFVRYRGIFQCCCAHLIGKFSKVVLIPCVHCPTERKRSNCRSVWQENPSKGTPTGRLFLWQPGRRTVGQEETQSERTTSTITDLSSEDPELHCDRRSCDR